MSKPRPSAVGRKKNHAPKFVLFSNCAVHSARIRAPLALSRPRQWKTHSITTGRLVIAVAETSKNSLDKAFPGCSQSVPNQSLSFFSGNLDCCASITTAATCSPWKNPLIKLTRCTVALSYGCLAVWLAKIKLKNSRQKVVYNCTTRHLGIG